MTSDSLRREKRRLMLAFLFAAICGCRGPVTKVAPLPFTPAPDVPPARRIAELQSFIPAEMARENVPGLEIALIHDGRVFWSEGYGVANSLTRRIVLADTPFKPAALGKPLVAYAALRLVQDGRLDLHRPLSSYLTNQFVAPSPHRDEITAWHVLTHTSGLSDNFLESSHEVAFKPGSRFSYSGVGFMYLQRVIETVSGRPFEDFMRDTVFAQLGMGSTSYFLSSCEDRIARGHLYLLGFALPTPFPSVPEPVASNLMCSTAGDFAKFIIELMDPRHLDKGLVTQMMTPQVHGDVEGEPMTWGLGIGLIPTAKETCFWQWGSSSNYKSYLVGCPVTKTGVAILTNSARGRIIARTIAAKALGE
ncbi:MAG TPA: serine hydrolase domain-containing protein [Candidatus Binataceae bacterium]|nr:serine hydrolase domain-containing protein [Candidatus Binataceae bacterium]